MPTGEADATLAGNENLVLNGVSVVSVVNSGSRSRHGYVVGVVDVVCSNAGTAGNRVQRAPHLLSPDSNFFGGL
jgi:hypothetical protein